MGPRSAPPQESEFVTFKSGRDVSSVPDVRILHYNDVYHLDPSSAEPVGGVARFQTVVNEYRSGDKFRGQPELVTLFSGDVFNPSLESSITKGSHMVPILNQLGTDCACVGNHDLDFGVRQYRYLTGRTKFPWLLANVLDPALGEGVPIGNAQRTHMITTSSGIKIGLIGVGEREWLETVNSLPPDLIYRSATETVKELAPQLRKDGADMIIVLSHAREPNDQKLAKNVGDSGIVDFILGGHDHFYAHSFINGTHALRSGSDFKQLSYIEARRKPGGGSGGKWDFDVWRRDIVSSIAEDKPTVELVRKLTAKLKQSLEKPVGWTAAPLDARFTTVRLKESNLGNFVCDIMRHHYQADCVIMAAGTIRGDQIYPPGPIRVKDITDCFPFEDPVVVIKVTGKAIWDALENGVALYPALEGRFPQVSNIKFSFDPSKPVGSRIVAAKIGDQPIDFQRTYVLCTRGYMARGKDGYKSLLIQEEGGSAEAVVDEENGILISMMLRQYFMSLKVMDQWANWSPSLDRHWGTVVSSVGNHHPHRPSEARKPSGDDTNSPSSPRKEGWEGWKAPELRARRSSIAPLDEKVIEGATDLSAEQGEEAACIDRELRLARKFVRKWCHRAGVHAQVCDELKEGEYEAGWTKAVAPKLEGRIQLVGSEA